MNPYTGELTRREADEQFSDGFEVLPRALQRIAQQKLQRAEARHEPAIVNLRGRSPLAQWAKKKRLAKIAAQSRRRNRK